MIVIPLLGLVWSATLANGCGGNVTCTDANIQLISASNYTLTCSADSDCVAVSVGNACFPCTLVCKDGAIARSALAAYQADVSKTIGAHESPGNCNCPGEGIPCCRSGACTVVCN